VGRQSIRYPLVSTDLELVAAHLRKQALGMPGPAPEVTVYPDADPYPYLGATLGLVVVTLRVEPHQFVLLVDGGPRSDPAHAAAKIGDLLRMPQ
jgi:hypothetical protein